MASAEFHKRKLEEYQMQLFGFHSRAVYATLEAIVRKRINSKIEKLCDTLEKNGKLNLEDLTLLKTNQEQLQKAYNTAALPYLKNIENVVNKCIAVPDNVLLEEDKDQRIQYTDSEVESIKQKLEDLQQRAKRATMLNAALTDEIQIFAEFAACEDDANKFSAIIDNGLKCPDINDKMIRLVEKYSQFNRSAAGMTPTTEKMEYNTLENLKCKDCDFESL